MEKAKLERYERTYGPHFNEECAHKAVKKMENEGIVKVVGNGKGTKYHFDSFRPG